MEVLKSALRRLRPTIGPRVEEEMGIERLFWWRARKPHYLFGKLVYWTRSYNVGDILSPIIIQRILQNRGLFLKDMEAGRRLLAVGSILHFAREGDTIWGSGINGKIGTHEYCFTSLDVRADEAR